MWVKRLGLFARPRVRWAAGLVVGAVGLLSVANPAQAAERTQPSSTAQSALPILPLNPDAPGAATHLQAEVDCSHTELRKGVAQLRWTPAARPGREQRVAVTIFRDGFERNAVELSEPLSSTQSSLVWKPTQPGVIHFWRVLSLQANGWAPSAVANFQGATCVADFVPKARL